VARNRKRKVLIGLGIILLTFLLAILASPLWLPWLVRPMAAKHNVTFGQYQRDGYSRLSFSDVRYARGNAHFAAQKVKTLQPIVWLWKHYVSRSTAGYFAVVEDWTLEFSRNQARTNAPTKPARVIGKTRRALTAIRQWIPQAACTNGAVVIEGIRFDVPSMTWNGSQVEGLVLSEKYHQRANVRIELAPRPEHILIRSDTADATLDLKVAEVAELLKIDGTATWHTNQADVSVEFAEGWIPSRATAKSDKFVVPAEQLRLEGYRDPTGKFSAHWDGRRYHVDLQAGADPEQDSQFSPIKVDVKAAGDTNAVRVEKAVISTPWLNAKLSSGVEFNYSGKLLSPEAALFVDADLSKQEFIEATGSFSGEAFLRRSEKRFPYANFKLTSDGFAGYGMSLKRLNLEGKLDWPRVAITSTQLDFAEGGIGRGEAQINILTRAFESGRVELKGPIEHELLPANFSYTNINVALNFSGPFKQLAYDGRMKVDGLSLPAMETMSLTTTWAGSARKLDKLDIEAKVKNTTLNLGGAATLQTNALALDLKHLSLTGSNDLRLELQQPASIRIRGKNVELSPLELRDQSRALLVEGSLALPNSGRFHVSATNFLSTDFQDFFSEPVAALAVDRLAFSGSWTNGPLDFTLRGTGEFFPFETNRLSIAVTGSGNARGISFEKLTVLSETEPVVNGRGFVPIQILPGAVTNRIRIKPQQPIDLRLDTSPSPAFWDRIARWTQVRFTDPEVNAVVSGTLENPKGRIVARIARLQWIGTTNDLPKVEKVSANIDLNEHSVRLRNLKLLIEGEPFMAHAELPVGDLSRSWRKVFDWRKASGRVSGTDIQFAPFAKYIPDILSPQGEMDLDVAFAPGMLLDGFLIITNAATRPLPSSGALHDLQARLRFKNHVVEFENARGLLGGQLVGIFGDVDFSKTRRNLPLINLSLLGDGVPLARRPETILRGDLKLKISNLTNDIPLVSGEVRLRDSFYLGDIKQLIPGRVISPKLRPPYFSVEAKPMNEWLLDVRVVGESFLNVRSPLFHGAVSADWKITGTLGEPIALGDAEIESGLIKFPFANFRVTQGFMTLTSEDPYRPEVFATATSRAFGYDLQMELSGSANQPVVEFTSTPALTSEQIIAMVTTGEVPDRSFGVSDQQRAQRLALFLGRSLLSRFSDPAGAERLTISTGEEISEEGRETYGLEYKLSEDWSIVGEYDRFGAVNAGVKWRIFSK
jgi:translocation and assembly module TamB